ncbi:MAG: RNA-binding protein [Clostridiaceae bacterium]|nr:RNA-binding protein [Clostridiaceae bacterium]
MDKKSFVNLFLLEDKNSISNLFDKVILANRTGQTIYLNEFYTPKVWKTLERIQIELGIKVFNYGLFEDSDRRMIAFTEEDELKFPVKILSIKNKSKFSTLKHKDYLGAIMSLGIKREKFGDVVLNTEGCYFPICSDISDYVFINLNTIGNSPCSYEVLDSSINVNLTRNYEEKVVISSSLRMDCIVSSICNISRSTAVELIDNGKVLLDYIEIKSKEKKVCPESVLTVRGYGKFKVGEEIGTTQKDRIRLLIKKYI